MVTALVLVTKILSLLILGLSMFFNSVGIYLLKTTKNFGPSQIIIILNLSATELVIAVGFIIQDAFTLKGNDYTIYFNRTVGHIVWGIRSGIYTVWYFVMFFLTIDRFLSCNFPIKHRKFATRHKIKLVLIIVWILGLINAAILCANFHLFYNIYTKFVWLTLDAALLLIIIVTYSTIFIRRIKCKRNSGSRHSEHGGVRTRRSLSHQQIIKVTGLIVVTFVLFEVAPTTAYLLLFKVTSNGSELVLSIILLSYYLVILTDPMIYIFLQDRIRNRFIQEARKLFRCTSIQHTHCRNKIGASGPTSTQMKKVTVIPIKECSQGINIQAL